MNRNDLLTNVYGSRLWKDIKVDFINEAKRVNTMAKQSQFFAKWNFYYMHETPISTLKGRGAEIRKALNEAGIKSDSPLYDFFKVPTSIYATINKKYDNEIKEKLLSDDESGIDYVSVSNEIFETLISSINDSDVLQISNNSRKSRELAYQKLFVLALATGRRQIELLKLIEISKKKELVLYRNLAKKKENDKEQVTAPIIGIDIYTAKKYLQDVRDEFKTAELTNKKVNGNYNESIKKALFRYIPKELAEKGFHFFRPMYAEICYQKFGGNAEKNVYFSEIFGHELKLNSAHSYQAKIK